jgi:hypothetical protein
MTPERYSAIKHIFQQAVELPHSKRPEFLEVACGLDEAMRAEIESLLAAHEVTGTQLIDEPISELLHRLGGKKDP